MARTTWGPLSTDEQNQTEFTDPSTGAGLNGVSGTGLVSVTSGVADTPAVTLSDRVAADAANLRTQLGVSSASGTSGALVKFTGTSSMGNSILTETGSVLTMTGQLVIGGGTVAASTPLLSKTQTWNNGAALFVGETVNVTDTASLVTSRLADWQVGGVNKFSIAKDGSTYIWGAYTSASEWRRVRTTMTTGGAATIAAESLVAGSAGTGNGLILSQNGSSVLDFHTTPQVASFSGYPEVADSKGFLWSTRLSLTTPAASQLLLGNRAITDANFFLKLGHNSSSAAGIKRVLNELQVRLNDDTAFAALSCGLFTLNDSNVVLGTTTGSKIGTATTQKLGFWNATPIVQPSSTGQNSGFTTGVGTHVHEVSTFTGGIGDTAYRISDIVRHLKSLGLIAQ